MVTSLDHATITTILVGAASIAVLVALWLLDRRRSHKAITYYFASARILEPERLFGGELRMTFRGEPVSDATMLQVQIRNASATPILRSDYDGSLIITLPGTKQMLTAEVGSRKPMDLDVQALSFGDAGVQISPLLLNAGDEFTLFILASGFGGEVELHGRIAGVGRFERRDPSKPSYSYTMYAGTMAGFGTALLVMLLATGWMISSEMGWTILRKVIAYALVMVLFSLGYTLYRALS